MANKKIMISGIKPTGIPQLGNYIGAISNWQKLQDEYESIYFLADLHALTIRQSNDELREEIFKTFAIMLASGLDPEKSLLFIQSQVPTHAQAGWILQCFTQFGELSRMTQFKDKFQGSNTANVNAGLFAYPSLMAADILLYDADFVPVGEDQKQHIEITRDIANRVNHIYGNIFKIPEDYIPKTGARIMSLLDPVKKMSKSDENPKQYISIIDEPKTIIKKFKSAVTDSEAVVRYGEGKSGINNLMDIYSSLTGDSFEEIENQFSGKGYGDFKVAVGEIVVAELEPVRNKYIDLLKNKDYLIEVAKNGAEKATEISQKVLDRLIAAIGLLKF